MMACSLRPRPLSAAILLVTTCVLACSCAEQRPNPRLSGQDLRVTFLHIADIHARFLPYREQVTLTNTTLGMNQDNEPFGGIARLAHLVHRERAKSKRTLLLDSGDCFQGAPIFNVFKGELAIRTMNMLRPDAVVVGNHEFDAGLKNYIKQLKEWSTFPTVAANYMFVPGNELGDLVEPFVIVNVEGLKVGIIGIANFSSLSSITDVGNSLGIIPLNIEQTVQEYVDILRPQVDLIVATSHASLSKDERLIKCTTGLDIVFGGHLHIALKPPKVVEDASGRSVLLVHSGAFARFLGKLDVVVREGEDPHEGWEVAQHKYELFAVDSAVPEDAKMLEMVEPYRLELNRQIDLTSIFAYTPRLLTKYGYGGGDSGLGNLVAETIREYARVDIGFTNTLGIRSNLYPGVVTQDDLYNIFPFENSLTLMYMSGTDIQALMDYVTQRSAGRGCISQLQVSGVEFTMNCNFAPAECRCDSRGPVCPGAIEFSPVQARGYQCYGRDAATDRLLTDVCRQECQCPEGATWVSECRCPPMAQDIFLTPCADPTDIVKEGCERTPLDLSAIYEVATNDYIAHGGSGFMILRNNNTQLDTGLPMREAVLEKMIRSPRCIEECRTDSGEISVSECATYRGCVAAAIRFHDQFCKHLTDDDPEFRDVPNQCAVDSQTCDKEADCHNVDTVCADGACLACRVDSDCDLAGGERCFAGFCRPDEYRCVESRCFTTCHSDEDCIGFGEVPVVQHLCVGGMCIPGSDDMCWDEHDCAAGADQCLTPGSSASCNQDEDCPMGLVCRGRICVPPRIECNTPNDCLEATGEFSPCIDGLCVFDSAQCTSDETCGPDGQCTDGNACLKPCQVCRTDAGCPDGYICGKGYCVKSLHVCEANRCRLQCDADDDCAAGTVCDDGRCLPLACSVPQDRETVCRAENVYRAQEECKMLPCPSSGIDGRIKRILPENLENLPDVYDFDDPEDIDENVFGAEG